MLDSTTSCLFCQDSFVSSGTKEYAAFYGMNQVLGEYLLQDISFVVLHDINSFPQNGAHLLFVPTGKEKTKYHPLSFAQIGLDETILERFIMQWIETLFRLYPSLKTAIICEHGMGYLHQKSKLIQIKCGGCGIEHAHMHLFLYPVPNKIIHKIAVTTKSFGLNQVEHSHLFPSGLDTHDKPYFYFGLVKKDTRQIESMIFTQTLFQAPIPSQFFRKILKNQDELFSYDDLQYLPNQALKKYIANRKKFRKLLATKPIIH